MSTLTPNYGLHLPEDTDSMDDFFTNYESDMETIDDNLGGGGGATIEEMTQAEYEALPDTKLTDGILRGLKDVKSFLDADILYLGTCYSLSERMVGCWISGKPLYQRTINFGSLNAGQGKSVAHGIANIETIVNYDGIGYNTVENRWNSLPRVDDDVSYQRGIAVGLTNIVIWGAGNTQAMSDVYVTIWYTKTTDAAGSGTWTPSGVNSVHYSTNEQIIGTWIDGKPLYQKSYSLTSGIAIGSYGHISMPSNSIIRKLEGYAYRSSHTVVDKFNGYIANGELFASIRSGQIEYWISNIFDPVEEIEFTVCYTKTTD